jgi:hypothetical protein
VQAAEAVVEAVHPARDALHAPRHAVEPAVELRERLRQLVRDRLDRPHDRRDRGVLRVQLGHGLVEPLGQHADLGAVGQLGQPLAHGAERVEGSETRVDLVERVEDLLLFALADLRGAVEHAAHAVERHGRVCTHGERSFLLCGKGSGRKCSDTAESPTRRVPVWSLHPRSEQFRPPKTPARRCSTVTGCLYPRPCR